MNKNKLFRFFCVGFCIFLLALLFRVIPAFGQNLGPARTAAIRELSAHVARGVPFAVQEAEIIDAVEAGLAVADIEADIVIARSLYAAYVAGEPLSKKQRELLARWREKRGQFQVSPIWLTPVIKKVGDMGGCAHVQQLGDLA